MTGFLCIHVRWEAYANAQQGPEALKAHGVGGVHTLPCFSIANLIGLFWLYWQAAKQALTLAREVRDIDLIGQVLQALWGS